MHILLTSNPQTSVSSTTSFIAKTSRSELWVAFGCHFCPLHIVDFCDLGTLEDDRPITLANVPSGGFDSIQVICLWQEHHRNGAVSSYPLIWATILVCPITDDFTLIPGLRWHLLGFFTAETFSPLVINNYLWGGTMFLLVSIKLSIYSLLIQYEVILPLWIKGLKPIIVSLHHNGPLSQFPVRTHSSCLLCPSDSPFDHTLLFAPGSFCAFPSYSWKGPFSTWNLTFLEGKISM